MLPKFTGARYISKPSLEFVSNTGYSVPFAIPSAKSFELNDALPAMKLVINLLPNLVITLGER